MKPTYWPRACRELSSRDPVMKKIILSYKGECIRSRGEAFETLLRSIVGQQISVKAAHSIWNRLVENMNSVQPENLLQLKTLQMRKVGLSVRKIEYTQDLARKFLDGSLNPHLWPTQNDEEIIESLIAVRGIGRWTAEMFLIFHLLRPNIFQKADLGLQKALALSYKKRYPMSANQLEIFRKKFQPWGSVATWYLWRSLDPIPVEY